MSENIGVMTIFCDIDGCLVRHSGNMSTQITSPGGLLPGVKEKFVEWDRSGYKIVLITGRREALRATTEQLLLESGLFWDMLIMGLPRGPRAVVNDKKPDGTITTLQYCPDRNKGLEECPF